MKSFEFYFNWTLDGFGALMLGVTIGHDGPWTIWLSYLTGRWLGTVTTRIMRRRQHAKVRKLVEEVDSRTRSP